MAIVDKRIKLLIVEPVSDLGGVSQYILSIVRYLPRDRFEIHVAAAGNGPLFGLLKQEGILVHTEKTNYSVFTFLSAVYCLRRFFQRENFGLVHAHTAKAGFICCIANWRLRARIIYTGHGFRFTQKSFFLVKVLFFWFERSICRSSDFVTVLSKTEYDFGVLKGLLNNHESRIVSMAIDVDRFRNDHQQAAHEQKRRLGIPGSSFVVGMVGRVTFQKDPETFVRAADILSSKVKDVRFLWVGDGVLKEKTLRSAKSLGLSDRLIISGEQNSSDIPMMLSVIDVVLFTSRFEGLPIALLEAMAARKLIVAANVGGVRDIIKDGVTGWLFEAGDFRTAASIIKNICDHKRELDHVRQAAFDFVVRNYSPKEKMAKEFQTIYEQVIS